jgi:hypothetical protein
MKKKSLTTLPPATASSPETLAKAKLALGEKPLTRMEEIEADEKWLREKPKQRAPITQLQKDAWERIADEILKKEAESRRNPSSEDDATELEFSLEECDYETGDELGDEDAPQLSASDNEGVGPKKIIPPWMKPGYDDHADEKIRFQYYAFDSGLRRAGVTMARSLPDHIWDALKEHQALVGPAAIASSQSSWNQSTTANKFTQSVAGDSDDDEGAENKNLGFGFEPAYKTLNATARYVTPENAWVFSEERFQDFIARLMDPDAIALYEKDPDNPLGVAQLFKRALKAWFNLYFFYRTSTSDRGFSEMDGLQVPKGLWKIGPDDTDTAARKMHRKRLLADGIALYGVPPDWKPLDPESITRAKNLWPLFERIRHQVVAHKESATCKKTAGNKSGQNGKK